MHGTFQPGYDVARLEAAYAVCPRRIERGARWDPRADLHVVNPPPTTDLLSRGKTLLNLRALPKMERCGVK
jgi:hypothetical protein